MKCGRTEKTINEMKFKANHISDIYELIYSYRVSKLIMVAVDYGLFDLLKDTSLSISEIESKTHLENYLVEPLILSLSEIGLLIEEGNKFRNLQLTNECLLSESPDSLVPYIIDSFSKDNRAFLKEYPIHTDTDLVKRMTSSTEFYLTFPFKQNRVPIFNSFIDIGGNIGRLSVEICDIYKQAKGILFDKFDEDKCSIAVAEKFIKENSANVEILRGDYFNIPSNLNADLAVIARCLHHHTNSECLQILKNIATVSGYVIIIDRMFKDDKDNYLFGHLQSLSMSSNRRAKMYMRRISDYIKFLEEAGFDYCENYLSVGTNNYFGLVGKLKGHNAK